MINRYLKDRAMKRMDRSNGRRNDRRYYGTNDRNYRNDYNSDYYGHETERNYDYARYDRKYERDVEDDYYQELERWISKLKRKNKFNINESQVIEMAKRSNLKMQDYDEKEFYATFLMMVSDYTKVSSDPQVFIEMAKSFLEDDDTELKGSEKLCKYLYAIVLNDDE